jgi:hypothetical protein
LERAKLPGDRPRSPTGTVHGSALDVIGRHQRRRWRHCVRQVLHGSSKVNGARIGCVEHAHHTDRKALIKASLVARGGGVELGRQLEYIQAVKDSIIA